MLFRPGSLVVVLTLFFCCYHPTGASIAPQDNTTYYVSSSTGNDANDGLSEDTPFQTIEQVNQLTLGPGDQVRFACGDTWRAEMLYIEASGTASNPIVFGSYPADCTDQPILSGAQPIEGWSQESGNIYVADLNSGANVGRFAFGINQLFRADERLPLGRWPNLDSNDDGGYATIDAQPAANQITDSALPDGDWSGAIAHIKGMRWYILNRQVTSQSGKTLTLNADAGCFGDNECAGWGYFVQNHLSTLDQDGEWYYDADANRVYLFSASGVPTDIEGSVVMTDDDRSWGGIVLGQDLGDEIAYVTVENLNVQRWYRHGIASPTNLRDRENSFLTLRNNTISDVDSIGISLATWVYDAQDGPSGWRGGNNITIANNSIDGANHKGIDTYGRDSRIEANQIRNIGLIENLNASGMGCGLEAGEGACTEDATGIRIKIGEADYAGRDNVLRLNRLETIGYNGIDIFGYGNTVEQNYIYQACYAKGDCGAVRTFGRDSLAASNVHDITIRNNIIVDTIGNTDGTIEQYRPLFGMGLYIDNYSRDVTVSGNTIIGSTIDGILYQRSTGMITDNTLYNNNAGTMGRGQVNLSQDVTEVSQMSGNILYGNNVTDQFTFARTLIVGQLSNLVASDNNRFFQPYRADHIAADGNKTLAEWQAFSGIDANSDEAWFTQEVGEEPLSEIFYNATSAATEVDLGQQAYIDLDQNQVSGSITLQPFTSIILIRSGEAPPPISVDAGDDQTVFPGDTITLTGTAEGATQVAWRQLSGESVTLDPDDALTTTFVAPETEGTLTFELSGSNDSGSTVTDTVDVIVQAISVAAGPDQRVLYGDEVTLEGSGMGISAFRWEQTGGVTVSLDTPNQARTTLTAPLTSTVLTLQLTGLTASGNLSGTDSVDIRVKAVIASANADTLNAQPGDVVQLDGRASRVYAAAGSTAEMTYAWTQPDGQDIALSDTSAVTPTFTVPATMRVQQLNALSFTLTVSSQQEQDSDDVTVQVGSPSVYLPLIWRTN
ncbi:MAG: hypothetical protein HC837_00825 [Chloroflexaceae bacterium]|nr:hypothetical protein [Chloroflexaceae bacterium]